MNKKKIITCCIFSALILFTIIYTVIGAADTYQYEIQHDDILEGLGAALTVLIGGFIAFYELDLFCTVYYFLFKPKSIAKSIFCVLSNLCFVFIFAYMYLSNRYMALRKYEITPLLLLVLYVIFRIVYALIPASVRKSDKE